MKHLFFLLFLLGIPPLLAQQNGIDQSLDLVTLSTGEKVIRWYGHSDRSYFVQVSDPAKHLSKWNWAPIIEGGNDEDITFEVDGTASKGFFRLKYTDQVPGPGKTLDTADFDDDGLSNLSEITATSPADPQTDPLNSDTDGDGLPDGWEVANGLNPSDGSNEHGANGDPDNDGLVNLLEHQFGTDPNDPDSDTDGLSDGDEVDLHFTSPVLMDTDSDDLTDFDEVFIYFTDPRYKDTDGDGLTDSDEINIHGTDPNLWDTDGDWLGDGFEITYGFDPFEDTPSDIDTDGDGINLFEEQSAGTNPGIADSDGDGVNDGFELERGTSPTNPDTDGDAVPDKFEITLKSKKRYKNQGKYGFSTYQTTTPPKMYLKEVSSWTNMSGGNPESGPNGIGPGSRTKVYDPLTGSYSVQYSGVGGSYASTATSPTNKHNSITISNYDDPPNDINDEPGTVTADSTLSDENTTDMLQANTNTLLSAYPVDFDYGGYAEADKSVDEMRYTLRTMKYKLTFGGSIQANLKWLEMFTPEDDPSTTEDESENRTFTSKSWSGTGAETPEFEINPYTVDPAKDGSYNILYVDNVNVEGLDPESHKIPSNKYAENIMGKEHIVCVKDTGDIVIYGSFNRGLPVPALNKVTWECSNATITSPAYGTGPVNRLTAKLSSATAGQFPVTMKLDGKTVWEGVVWVVWATGVSNNRPLEIAEREDVTSYISADWDFEFTIQPIAVVADSDHPDLSGSNAENPPGGEKLHLIDNDPLSEGVDKKWDVSRQSRSKVFNPFLYPKSQLSEIQGTYYDNQPIAIDIPDLFPDNPAEGNDDSATNDEINDPYNSAHSGKLSSVDNPCCVMKNATGKTMDTFEERYQFREFARVELNGVWYRVSDYVRWRVHYKFERRYVGGGSIWCNNGSDQAQNNDGF